MMFSAIVLDVAGTAAATTDLAAVTYFSSSRGESVRTSPILSNPCPVSSGGNSTEVS
jgi:hypothetical protein